MKKVIIGSLILLMTGVVNAQSYHFSQFFSTPLLTNPANTGFTNGPFRISSNFRSQGLQGGSSFFTGYVSADASPLRDRLTEGHKAGIGLYVMNDQSQGGALKTNSVGLSAAYHVGLDIYGEESIGLGLQGTYNQRRLDYSQLSFENQFGPSGYDPTRPIGEAFNNQSSHFFDVNAGVVYNRNVDNRSLFAGLSVYNILRPKQNILEEEYTLPMRIAFQAGSQVPINTGSNAYFSLTAMHQGGTTEATLGGAFGFNFTEEEKNELIGGLWYRFRDAVIPYVGYHGKSFQAGLSYDYTVSALKTGAQIKNAAEFTLIFKAPDNRQLKANIPWY